MHRLLHHALLQPSSAAGRAGCSGALSVIASQIGSGAMAQGLAAARCAADAPCSASGLAEGAASQLAASAPTWPLHSPGRRLWEPSPCAAAAAQRSAASSSPHGWGPCLIVPHGHVVALSGSGSGHVAQQHLHQQPWAQLWPAVMPPTAERLPPWAPVGIAPPGASRRGDLVVPLDAPSHPSTPCQPLADPPHAPQPAPPHAPPQQSPLQCSRGNTYQPHCRRRVKKHGLAKRCAAQAGGPSNGCAVDDLGSNAH